MHCHGQPAAAPLAPAPVYLSSAPFIPCQQPSRGTNVVINNLAICTSSQGQHAEVEQLYRQALELCDRVLGGAQHPDAVAMRKRLAACREGRS